MVDEAREIEDGSDGDYALERSTVAEVLAAVEARDAGALEQVLEPLHAADIADLLEQIDGKQRRKFLALWGVELDGDVLSELDEGLRVEVIGEMSPEALAEAVRDLDSDDVVDLIEDLEATDQQTILDALEAPDRVAVEQALSYPEYSAGRLMQRELVKAPEHWTVGQTIDYLRREDDTMLPEQFYHVILVDPRLKPVGYVTLGRLLASRRAAKLIDIAEDSFRTISVLQPEEDVAYAFNQYHLISAPVVDEDERLVGVITIDDAMAVLDEEHEEDIKRLAGVGDESLSDKTLEIARRRFPWLAVNLVTAVMASFVIAQFEEVITAIVALAVLMPIVASMGGNAGTQTLTVTVRAIATRDLTGANAWRVLRREVLAALINGMIFAVVIGIVGVIWFGDLRLGYVIAAAMVINMAVAGFAGLLIPIALDKLGVDPALASGAFVTTVTDVVGFLSFLGLAALVLI